MSKSNNQIYRNLAIIIVAFFIIGAFLGPNANQVYSGISVTGADTVELTNDGNLDTKVRDFSLTVPGGGDGNLNYIEFSPDESMISGSNSNMPLGLYINIPSGVSVNGGNIRITDQDNNGIPREIESYDSGNLMVWYKPGVTDSSDVVYRIWYGNTAVAEPASGSTYGSEAVWSGYEAVWLMNENPTGTITDHTGNGHDGATAGFVSGDLIADTYGKKINFDGVDGHITTNRVTELEGVTETWTIGVNAAFDVAAANNILFGYNADGSVGTGDIYAHYASATSTIKHGVGAGEVDTTISDVSDTNMHFMTFAHTATNTVVYEDGVNKYDAAMGGTVASASHTFRLGENYHVAYLNGKIGFAYIHPDALSGNYVTTQYKNLNNPTAVGTDPFYKSIGVEQIVQIIDPSLTVGDDKLYYDGILSSTLTYSDGSAFIDSSDVSVSMEGSLPIIKVGTTQNIKIDHGLEYSISYLPKNMDVLSPNMFCAGEDMRVDTRLTDTSGNPTSYQPLEMRIRLFDINDKQYLDEIVSSTSFVVPGKYLHDNKHYQIRLSYEGYEFGGWSNEVLADFDIGIEGFTITSSPDKAPQGALAASFAAVGGLVGMAVTGWLDVPIIGDIIRFIADLVGVEL